MLILFTNNFVDYRGMSWNRSGWYSGLYKCSDRTNGQSVVLQCTTNFAVSTTVTCTCDTSGETNMFTCDAEAPTCETSKF